MKFSSIFLLLSILIFLVSCQKENSSISFTDEEYNVVSKNLSIPIELYDYTPKVTGHMNLVIPELEKKLERRESHDYKATLGRVIFYDKRLSKNNEISCASCHIHSRAFTDGEKTSPGFEGIRGHRNTLALATTVGFETAYGGGEFFEFGPGIPFGWTETTATMDEQSRLAITSEIEMGMSIKELLDKLGDDPTYKILFQKAHGYDQIDEHGILSGLRSFINSISTVNTKFDTGLAMVEGNTSQDFPNFSESENRGKGLFNVHCGSCHGMDHTFFTSPASNNGLEKIYKDKGKGGITGSIYDMGMFKVPFLRNIMLTAPYMHDGRFATIDEVIDHYSHGIVDHENLGFQLRDRNGGPTRFNFTASEKSALIDYLLTLTDESVITDTKFSDPFK